MGRFLEGEPYLPELKTNPYPGLFIDIEGMDGSGLSTQVWLLGNNLLERGVVPLTTKEPAENVFLGKEIRQILRREVTQEPLKLQEMFVANRRAHLEKEIIPCLKAGQPVISDRYLWSTIAYGSLDISPFELLKMNQDFLLPDITILLNVSYRKCMQRINTSRPFCEFFEVLEKMEKIQKTYQWLAKEFSGNIRVIDGEREREEINQEIFNLIINHPKSLSVVSCP